MQQSVLPRILTQPVYGVDTSQVRDGFIDSTSYVNLDSGTNYWAEGVDLNVKAAFS